VSAVLLASLRKEVLEQWRTYRLLVAAVVLLVFGLTSPLLAKFTPELLKMLPNGEQIAGLIPPPTLMDAVGQYVKNMSQFGVILALLLAMGSVAQEKERGTAGMMLVKPLPRWVFLAAKFAALGLTFAVSIALAGAACYYYTYLLFGPLPAGAWLALNALLLAYSLVYAALTLFASAVMRSQTAAGGLAFGLMLLLAIPGAIPQVSEYLPARLVGWGVELVAGQPGSHWPALWVSLGLIAASLVAGWWVFDRQEL
jgi:ABC-2 type transport system permease protein